MYERCSPRDHQAIDRGTLPNSANEAHANPQDECDLVEAAAQVLLQQKKNKKNK